MRPLDPKAGGSAVLSGLGYAGQNEMEPWKDPYAGGVGTGSVPTDLPYNRSSEYEKYLADEQQMMQANGQSGPVPSMTLPPGQTWDDFFGLLSTSEKFSASAGGRYFPTQSQMYFMLANGYAHADDAQVFQYLSKAHGLNLPWASAGLTKTQYNDQKESMTNAIADYTGDANAFPELASTAIANRWQTDHVIRELTNNPKYAAKYPWLKFNMTANAFKSYKRENRSLAQQRWGQKVSDTQYASMLEEAAPHRQTAGGAVALPTGQNALVRQGVSQSSVR